MASRAKAICEKPRPSPISITTARGAEVGLPHASAANATTAVGAVAVSQPRSRGRGRRDGASSNMSSTLVRVGDDWQTGG